MGSFKKLSSHYNEASGVCKARGSWSSPRLRKADNRLLSLVLVGSDLTMLDRISQFLQSTSFRTKRLLKNSISAYFSVQDKGAILPKKTLKQSVTSLADEFGAKWISALFV